MEQQQQRQRDGIWRRLKRMVLQHTYWPSAVRALQTIRPLSPCAQIPAARAIVCVIKRAFTPTCNLFCVETSARWAAVCLLRVEFFVYAECKSVRTECALPMYTGTRTR